ncbi:hypothetical protein T484DRAFT_1860941 [Baffinella frigidus]|nr:hypothetical protein T484DRAFT_1860941 [Cryptophyta sp. CCMP2293]
MPSLKFARRVPAERRIVRQALLDAVLDAEPWSSTSSTSATQDSLKTAHNEDQADEVLDAEILHHSIGKLSLTFQSSSLRDILAASAAPPPRLPNAISRGACTWRGAAASSWRGATGGSFLSLPAEEQPEASRAWGTLAQRFKLARPASSSHTLADDECAPNVTCSNAGSFVSATSSFSASAAGTFYLQQSMPEKGQGSFWDLPVSVGEDGTLQQHDAACLL